MDRPKKHFSLSEMDSLKVRYLALLVIIALFMAFFAIMNPAFIAPSNLMNIVRQTGVTLIVSIGMTFAILIGGIDLSVGSNVAVSGMLGIVVLKATNSVILAVLSTLFCAIIFGSVNGYLIGRMGMTAFIVTLAMQFVGRGATMLLNGAKSIKVNDPFYKLIGQGDILGLPAVLWLVIVLYIIFILVNEKTSYGAELYAIGGNPLAARASGIAVKRNIFSVYVLVGFICGIGALVTVGRMGSAQPYAGQNLEFACITAAVLGGTSLEGGKGRLKGTILGALLVGIVDNGLSLLQASKFIQYIVTGALVLAAVLSDIAVSNYSARKLIRKADTDRSADEKKDAGIKTGEENNNKFTEKKEHTVDMKGITKIFPGMKALDNVDFSVRPHEVMALMGENGAGKSTLMKILSGEYQASHGTIYIDNQPVNIDSAITAKRLGIALIHQEIALVPELTVAQNIYLGKEEKKKIPFFLNNRRMNREAQETLDRLGLSIDVTKKANSLAVSEQQMVEIAKALSSNAWLVIMDEPTSSLGEKEKDELFKFIARLKDQGICIVYISHRMQEIFAVCDKITILRDGKLVGVEDVSEANENKIINMMVGRELNDIFDREVNADIGNPILKVEHLCKNGVFNDISFEVHEKEVLGFSGLIGAGRTDIARCIFGLDIADGGRILVNGKPVKIRKPQDAMELGISYVPEDRKQDGFVPLMSIRDNIAMASYKQLSGKLGFINTAKEKELAEKYIQLLSIRTTSSKKNVVELSGGNQQKVTLANRLAILPKILILDEPTRGIDIGAKAEIHKLIAEIAKEGVAVILISSEMPELIGCSDRIAVFREGVMTKVLEREEFDQDRIMYYAAQR